MKRRGWRLEYVAGLAVALAVVAPAAKAQDAAAQAVPTQTTLSVTQGESGSAQATATVNVIGADGLPASGVVNIDDGARQLAETTLNAEGQTSATVTLPPGEHTLRAVYLGDAKHQTSASDSNELNTGTSSGPGANFQVSVTPISPATLPMTLTAGQSGSLTVTLTPVNNATLTSPMFVTLSCSGLPSLASCSFAPENVEILSTTPASCTAGSPASACPPTSLMVIETQGQGTAGTPAPPADRHGSPAGAALLLPGVLGLGGLAWGARRRRWLQRLALMGMVALVTTLGTTACNPFYYYYNHGPPVTPATPAGTYTVTVTAQTSNGVTAIINSTTLVLTVK